MVRINFNNATRDTVLDLPLHQVQPFYRALRAFVDVMNRPENVVTYKMEAGQLAPPPNSPAASGSEKGENDERDPQSVNMCSTLPPLIVFALINQFVQGIPSLVT